MVITSESLKFQIDDFNLRSSWTNRADGSISWPSTGSATKTVTVYGIPDGASVESATLYVRCGTGYGGPQLLTVNDLALTGGISNEVNVASLVTGNGAYDFIFRYQDYGIEGLAQGSHYGTMGFRDIALIVVYSGDQQGGDVEPGTTIDMPESEGICLYRPETNDFSDNGLGILRPSSCTVREEAGGEYEAELEIPTDGDLWSQIETESIIKIPVPIQTIDAFEIEGAAYWRIKENYAKAYVKSKVPTITYDTSDARPWAYNTYDKGDKVTYNGSVYQYQGYCAFIFSGVPSEVSGWTKITPTTTVNSGKTLATLNRGDIFTKLEDVNANWMRVKTSSGVEGYLETKYAEYHSEAGWGSGAREIRNQCFRVYRVDKDSTTSIITVNARHLSYDFARTYLGKCEQKAIQPIRAIQEIQKAALYEDNRQIITNINDKTVDLNCSWDNGVAALMNPDTGMVAQLQAKLIRDNEDFFILADQHTDRGYTIRRGKNLKSVRWAVDTSEMVTRITPHCKDKDGNDLLLPEQYVDSPLIDQYPVVYHEALNVNAQEDKKGTVDGQEVEHLTKEQCYTIMRQEARNRFEIDHADEPQIDIDIDMLMLGATVEYKQYADLDVLYMYDTVHIEDPTINLSTSAYMTGYEYDAILRRYKSITLTNARRRDATNVSGANLANNSIKFEKLSSTAIDRIKE